MVREQYQARDTSEGSNLMENYRAQIKGVGRILFCCSGYTSKKKLGTTGLFVER